MGNRERFKKLKLNSMFALSYQVILIVTGLILPRFFLYYYGSEVNGLITSITQFLSFINICDFGISAVVTSAYYKPLAENDIKSISKIYLYSKHFFKVIGIILCVYVAALIGIYPILIDNSFDFIFTATLIFSMALSLFGQYFFGISYQLIINADQRSYIRLFIGGVTLILNTIFCIILMMCNASIQMVKLSTSIIYLLRPFFMYLYIKKYYKIDYSVSYDSSVVSQKRNGIIQHLAYTIYENTDIMVLTFFSTLKNVSIYGVYTLVTNSIKQIIVSCTNGIEQLMGNMIAKKERESLISLYSFYNWSLHTISTIFYIVTGFLIVPFVMLYTKGVNDVNYSTPAFAILITIAGYLGTLRNGNFSLIRAAGKYKETQTASIIEMIINLSLSVIFVFAFGLVGVTVGTISATLFFIVFEIYYFSKEILKIKAESSIKLFATDLAVFAISFFILRNINIYNDTIASWIIHAAFTTLVCTCVSLIINLLFHKKQTKLIFDKILFRFRRKSNG